VNIRNYLLAGRIHSLWSKEEKIGASSLNSKATTNNALAVQELKHICPD
jgi:hypothetical protein